MASLSIRKLDPKAYELLRMNAAKHAVSMEEEARQIIYRAVSAPESISGIFQEYFGAANGIDLVDIRDLYKPHDPIDFT
jgi:plasmid stability protein